MAVVARTKWRRVVRMVLLSGYYACRADFSPGHCAQRPTSTPVYALYHFISDIFRAVFKDDAAKIGCLLHELREFAI